jgi:heme/copper-type cytochrome/quinol oxidase subunit 4
VVRTQSLVWLIFPVALTLTSLWVVVTGARTSRLQLGIIIALCILGCVRQGFVLWTKGQTAYGSVAFAAAVIGIAAGAILVFHLL